MRKVWKLFAADIPARTVGGLTGWSVQGTQRLSDGLRLRMMALKLAEAWPFAGEVEIDERDFGPRRVRGKRGRGAGGKSCVFGVAAGRSYDGARFRRWIQEKCKTHSNLRSSANSVQLMSNRWTWCSHPLVAGDGTDVDAKNVQEVSKQSN